MGRLSTSLYQPSRTLKFARPHHLSHIVGEVAARSAAGEGAATISTFRMPHPGAARRVDPLRGSTPRAGEIIIGGGPRRDEKSQSFRHLVLRAASKDVDGRHEATPVRFD
jgi:hypothetical protein